MACEFELILSGQSQDHLRQVGELALDELSGLDGQLSCFDPRSELSYVNAYAAGESVMVEPGLFELLTLAAEVSRETQGAFDVTAGPLIELWREAERSGTGPSADAIDAARELVGMRHVILDERDNSVRFDREGISMNLGAIGKGCAVGRAIEVLREHGIGSALISAGRSTVYGLGAQPDGKPWRIGIRHPERFDERVAAVELVDASLSTSGGPRQRDRAVEERFEHIIDPATGMPAWADVISATVIASDPALSDALSTAFYLRGKHFALDYCRAHEGVRALLVEAEGEEEFSVSEF